MIDRPKISIVIPTYNRAQYIEELFKNLTEQTFTNFEVCFIDDGSSDGTKDLLLQLQKKDSRIHPFFLTENKGATFARNFGIQKAQGDWIMLWDSDDLLYPNALEVLVSYEEKFPDINIFSAPAQASKKGVVVLFPERGEGMVTYEDILARRLPQNSKIRITKRSIMQQVTYISKNVDFLVNVELVKRGKWFHINKILGLLRIEDDEMSLTKQRKKKSVELSIERSNILDVFLNEHGKALFNESPVLFGAYAYGVAVGQLLAGNYKVARVRASEAIRGKKTLRGYVVYVLSRVYWGQNILRFLLKYIE